MFLGTAASVAPSSWSQDKSSFALVLEDNPLAHFGNSQVYLFIIICILILFT
jgi:hypothetical protein